MEVEQLYDGPLDGLKISHVAGPVYIPDAAELRGVVYRRRTDGRLYLENSKWGTNS